MKTAEEWAKHIRPDVALHNVDDVVRAIQADALRWAADELTPPPELPKDAGTFTATVFAKAFRAKADAIERGEEPNQEKGRG